MTARPAGKILVAAGIAVVVAAVIAGMLLIGLPSEQRQRRFDENRVEDLNALARAVDQYYRRYDRLPTFEELGGSISRPKTTTDPVTSEPYFYHVTGVQTYELCAVFAGNSREQPYVVYPPLRNWQHGAGKQCFELRAAR